MNTINNLPIDDELLAAYLDGKLDEKQSQYVENAIENSPELKWVVDRWIEEQTSVVAQTEVDSQRIASGAKPRQNRWKWSIAASIILVLGVSLPLLIKMSNINPNSGLPEGFPASARYESESHLVTPEPVIPYDGSALNKEKFQVQYEIYKSAAIITWNMQIDSASCIAYSNNRQSKFYYYTNRVNAKNRRSFVIPLDAFKSSEYPITVTYYFKGPDIACADSIVINSKY